MPHSTLRILACLAPALACFTVAAGAEAGVGAVSGGALSSVAHESPVQTVQSGECWEQNGPDGPGYYPCGDGGGGPIVGPAIRRHHRHGVIVSHPQATNPIHPGAQSGRVGAGGGVPSAKFARRRRPGIWRRRAFIRRRVSAPGPRRQFRPGSPACMGPAGPRERISARLPPRVLSAARPRFPTSLPRALWALRILARPPHPVLREFMVQPRSELSTAAASDIAKRVARRNACARSRRSRRDYCPMNTSKAAKIPLGSTCP